MSVLFTPAAPTSMSTSPSAGSGIGTSSRYSSFSGPPWPVSRMALMYDLWSPFVLTGAPDPEPLCLGENQNDGGGCGPNEEASEHVEGVMNAEIDAGEGNEETGE